MISRLRNSLAILAIGLIVNPAFGCEPLGLNQQELQELYESGFSLEDPDKEASQFLMGTLPCLSETDPFLRDLVSYEGTMTLLRKDDALTQSVLSALPKFKDGLLAKLEEDDPHGVIKPFAIILLAEVARTDRIHPWMSNDDRAELLITAETYLSNLTDYRAFDDKIGFRHGVAHGADLVLQLSLNQKVSPGELVPLVEAIGSKVDTDGTPYVTGEPGRLVRALLYIAQRAGPSEELRVSIQGLINDIKEPGDFENWGQVFKSERGLAFRHNRRSFAESLYAQFAPHGEHELIAPYMDGINQAVRGIP